MRRMWQSVGLGVVLSFGPGLLSQQKPQVVPVPQLHPQAPVSEPTEPPPQDVSDAREHVTFHLPAGWNVARRDGEVSTFRLDARGAPRRSQVRVVAALGFNPFPSTTFEGALFYVSSSAADSASACEAQASLPPSKPLPPEMIDGVRFVRGKDEHGAICTESRDISYTAMHQHACLRFDLVVNNFCGGEVSGAQDLTQAQLGSLFKRLETVLESVRLH